MKYRPHEYQQYAIEYIETHPVSAVLLDMGLGKTSITLTALQDLLFDRFEAHSFLRQNNDTKSPAPEGLLLVLRKSLKMRLFFMPGGEA